MSGSKSTFEDPQEHPGGRQIILKYAGRDATAAYMPVHPSDALKNTYRRINSLVP